MRVFHIVEHVLLAFMTGIWILAFVQVRRRRGAEERARLAEEALSSPRIGTITMPDPNDPRWTLATRAFVRWRYEPGKREPIRVKDQQDTLTIEDIVVGPECVWIGVGSDALPDSKRYAGLVWTAYQQRIAERVRGAAP